MLTIAEDSTRAGARLAERAAELELDGLMVLPAMRYVSTPRETIAHFRTVAAATDLRIMVYNNPVAYAVDITPPMFAEIADEPNFVAIKESSGDVRRITDIVNLVGDRYAIFTGVDDLALESLMLGAVGWVAGLVCAFPRETVAIYELALAGRYRGGARDLPLVHAAPPPRRLAPLRPEHQGGRADGARHLDRGAGAAPRTRGRGAGAGPRHRRRRARDAARPRPLRALTGNPASGTSRTGRGRLAYAVAAGDGRGSILPMPDQSTLRVAKSRPDSTTKPITEPASSARSSSLRMA